MVDTPHVRLWLGKTFKEALQQSNGIEVATIFSFGFAFAMPCQVLFHGPVQEFLDARAADIPDACTACIRQPFHNGIQESQCLCSLSASTILDQGNLIDLPLLPMLMPETIKPPRE